MVGFSKTGRVVGWSAVSLAVIGIAGAAAWRRECASDLRAARGRARSAPAVRTPRRLSPPLCFEENRGQTDASVKFIARGRGYVAFLTPTETVLSLRVPMGGGDGGGARDEGIPGDVPLFDAAVLRMRIEGSAPDGALRGEAELPGRVNYFLGNDPAAWRTDVPTFGKVRADDVLPGVDVVYAPDGRNMEYSLEFEPGADPAAVTLAVEGADRVALDDRGGLSLEIAGAVLRHTAPVAWQVSADGRPEPVAVSFELRGEGRAGFAVGAYDRERPLIVDPTLEYSTYLGGSSSDYFPIIAVDSSGSAYVGGTTSSTDFPTASGYQTSSGGTDDAFVTKMGIDGSSVQYSTYLGGSSIELVQSIAVNGIGQAFLAGITISTNYPTASAYQSTKGSSSDFFLTRLGVAGNSLVFSTFLGGSGIDHAMGLALDGSGNCFLGGRSTGSFPTASALDSTYGGGSFDAVVAKFNASGSSLLFATYLGGAGNDQAYAIAVDGSGDAYVTGYTSGTDYPTASAYQASSAGGGAEAFLSKVSADGSSLVFSTYLGGSAADEGFAVEVDGSGSAVVVGRTYSTDFPTVSPFQEDLSGDGDGFVTRFAPDGASLDNSTYLGGTAVDSCTDVALDRDGNAHLAGNTSSTGFPTAGPFQGSIAGFADAFVASLSADGSTLAFSSFLGGTSGDSAYGIALDGVGDAYVAGTTGSTDFPTVSAYDSSLAGSDVFVSKVAHHSIDIAPYWGSVTDSKTANKDSLKVVSTYAYNGESEDDDFDPTADAVKIRVGPVYDLQTLSIAANDSRWRTTSGIHYWAGSVGGRDWAVTVDEPGGILTVSCQKFTLGTLFASPYTVVMEFTGGDDEGLGAGPWRNTPASGYNTSANFGVLRLP